MGGRGCRVDPPKLPSCSCSGAHLLGQDAPPNAAWTGQPSHPDAGRLQSAPATTLYLLVIAAAHFVRLISVAVSSNHAIDKEGLRQQSSQQPMQTAHCWTLGTSHQNRPTLVSR
jgi:hypothetical protein